MIKTVIMKIFTKLFLITLLIFIQVSCSDWMELLPPQGLIREEFWKAKEDVEAAVMGTYDTFAQLDGLLFKYGEMRADLVQLDNNNTSEDDRKIMEGNIYPENSLCDWAKFYQVINYCNEVIKYAPLVKNI